mgnify:FL=1
MKRILIVLSSALALVACSGDSEQKDVVKTVLTVDVQDEDPGLEKQYSGMVKEAAEVSVAFKTPGQLSKIYVREGSHVAQGQLLATLDDSDYLLGVKAAESQYRQLNDEVARLRMLREANAVSGNDFEKALSGLEQLEVNLQVYQNKVKYTKLYAPTSGYIEKVNFEKAEMVDAGTPVFTLIADGGKEVEVSLPMSMYQRRDDIVSATAVIAGQPYQLRLLSIVPKADNTQLYRAIFAIVGAGPKVSPGMNADVKIKMSGDTPAMAGSEPAGYTLPLSSVFEQDSKSYVWVVQGDSIVSRREILTGSVDAEGRVAVRSGLDGSERVVRAGVTLLHEGDRVKVADKVSETNVGGLI